MAINMDEMLSAVSVSSDVQDTTFCNIYTRDGHALTDSVLGGLAAEDNLISAMQGADFAEPDTFDSFVQSFSAGEKGTVSFTYNGIKEMLCFIPIKDTDWQLTYLIRESVISDSINDISNNTVRRSLIQTLLTVAVMGAMFALIFVQIRKNNRLMLENQTAEAENRVKQEEMEQRLKLQDQLLAEQNQREEQNRMITALSSDYWSVYYLDLDNDKGVCYRSHSDLDGTGFKKDEHFPYLKSVTAYAEHYVTEQYRSESAIIILTAYNWDDILEEATKAGVDSFIAKPLFATHVMEEFSAALQRKGLSAKKEEHKADLNGRRILLAEDKKVNSKLMTVMLQRRGMEVDLAENGKTAVEKVATNPENHYSAVLMDIRMPEMDGLEAARQIRALDRSDIKSLPIIALTANAFDEDVQRSLQAGMNAHLSKPIKPDALYETLENLID